MHPLHRQEHRFGAGSDSPKAPQQDRGGGRDRAWPPRTPFQVPLTRLRGRQDAQFNCHRPFNTQSHWGHLSIRATLLWGAALSQDHHGLSQPPRTSLQPGLREPSEPVVRSWRGRWAVLWVHPQYCPHRRPSCFNARAFTVLISDYFDICTGFSC